MESILIGRGEVPVNLLSNMANRHGLIAGATGTGKTVSLQVLAEGFSRLGVPVFLADVKGDLAGLSQPAADHPKIKERIEKIGISHYQSQAFPVTFWDVFGEQGHPVRTTITEMGPLLLSRLLNLNETQEGVLNVTFRVADEEGLLILDMKDLRSMLNFLGENVPKIQTEYGNISRASIGAIQRALLVLDEQEGDRLFSEPALNIFDLIQTDATGKGMINILAADKLMQYPRAYATFLLWLLSELFENLPEVGDPEKPKMVFFFDEAHLLFDEAPKVLREKIEQVVRLIRSKGVGIYFISQNPLDIPEEVLGQLGNRIQHALRAFTPKDQKALRAAAETFRQNPKFKVEEVLARLGVGEALVSVLDERGSPTVVEQTLICPPESRIGPISASERETILRQSLISGFYEKSVDRDSAYELLKKRAETIAASQEKTQSANQARRGRRSDTILEALTKSTVRAMGSSFGRRLVRGVLGSLFGKGR